MGEVEEGRRDETERRGLKGVFYDRSSRDRVGATRAGRDAIVRSVGAKQRWRPTEAEEEDHAQEEVLGCPLQWVTCRQ